VRETLDAASLARWRSDPIAFVERVLCDPETGRPFVLSDAERQFLQRAFTLNDNGRLARSRSRARPRSRPSSCWR